MPEYPYRCIECVTDWSVIKSVASVDNPESCPACGLVTLEQCFAAKGVGSFVSTEGDWVGGKTIFQLHPGHPDRMVTSKLEMEQKYKKHGISMETGQFKTRAAQLAATVPASRRGAATEKTAMGGIITQDD